MFLHGPSQLTCNLIRQKKRAESSTQGFWDRKLSISCRSELNFVPSRRRSAAFLSRGTRESRTCISAVCVRHKTHATPLSSNRMADDGCTKHAGLLCCNHQLLQGVDACTTVQVDVAAQYDTDEHTATKSAIQRHKVKLHIMVRSLGRRDHRLLLQRDAQKDKLEGSPTCAWL